MSNPVPSCTHIKTNGEICGSPAVSGTEFCYHHSAVKTALAKGRANGNAHEGGFAPIPFVFPEDRASMQINFFLLLQAYNEQRIDQRTYNSMLSLLKSMARNLGKTGSLVESKVEEDSEPRSKSRDPSASSGQALGHPRPSSGNSKQEDVASDGLFEFSPELMARLEEIESLPMDDPSRAERIRAAIADGANELRAQGLGLIEI